MATRESRGQPARRRGGAASTARRSPLAPALAPARLAAVLLILLLTTTSARAGDSQPLLPGQTGWGLLLDGDEVDVWVVDGVAGGELSVTVRGDSKAGVQPTLTVIDLDTALPVVPDAKQLKGAGGATVKLVKLPLPSTGSYAVQVGTDGAAGAYRVQAKLRLPGNGKTKQLLQLDTGASAFLFFDAPAGATATITLKPGAGVFVNGLSGPGGFVALDQVPKGATLTLSAPDGGPLELAAAGTYALELSNVSGAPLALAAQVKLKTPKLAKDDKTTSEPLGTIGFADSSSVAPAEKAPGKGHPLTLVLSLPPGAALPTKVSVPLADAGTGSATSGKDYKSLAKTKLVLPQGAVDGEQFTAYVKLKDDKLPEGDETIALALGEPSLFLAPAPGNAHLLTITEDDPLKQLQVRLGSVDGPDVPAGGVIDLGSTQLFTQGAPLLLALTNEGSAAVTLMPPRLPAAQTDFVIDEVFTLGAPAATAPPGAPVVSAPPAAPPLGDPRHEATRRLPAAALDPSGGGVPLLPSWDADLDASVSALVLLDLPLPDGGLTALELTRRPLPFGAQATLRLDGRPVPGGPAALLGDLSLWSGRVAGRPDTRALLSASAGGLSGWIERPEGRVHLVPRPAPGQGWSRQVTAVMDDAQARALGLAPPPFRCATPAAGDDAPGGGGAGDGTLDGLTGEPGTPPGGPAAIDFSSPDGLPFQCRLAIETDTELAALFDDQAEPLLAYVAALWSANSELYERTLNVRFSIESVGLHTDGVDPWFGATAGDRLDELRDAWADDWPADADLAHMLSGADLGGGVAYLGVLCNQQYGFGVSGNLSGEATNANGMGTPLAFDVLVTAHEVGHNFGAPHTHDLCPTPIDSCAAANASPGACQTQFGVCQVGTIMSYCHTCGGLEAIELDFHPQIVPLMEGDLEASCLQAPLLLDPGEVVGYSLTFQPTSGTGQKGEVLLIEHDAFDQPQPFTANVSGQALP